MAGVGDGGAAGEPMWTAGQVARHLRIAESTLRSWHRRYGVGPHAPRPGRYRRYTAEDIGRLQRMRDLIRSGTLPSEAARVADASAADSVRLDGLPAELLAAARALDSGRCLTVLEQAVTACGVVEAWERLCRPTLAAVDADQLADPDCVDVEHVLSWAVAAVLHRRERPASTPDEPAIVLACTAGEQHTLALEALAAALAERGLPVRMLGAAVPTASLARAVALAHPAVVVLWSHSPYTADLEALRALEAFPARRLVAGPGWPEPQPAGTARLTSLPAAVELLASTATDRFSVPDTSPGLPAELP